MIHVWHPLMQVRHTTVNRIIAFRPNVLMTRSIIRIFGISCLIGTFG